MTDIIVEDGSKPAGANSYETVSNADGFLALMGNTAWGALTTDQKNALMVKAFFIVNDTATYIYDGQRESASQEGEWPRTGATYDRSGPAVPSGSIPSQIKRAQIVAAGGLADGSINWGAGVLGESGIVKTESLEGMSVTYFSPKETGVTAASGNSGPFSDLGWPSVTAIVAPLLDIEAYEDAAPSDDAGGGVDPDISARRGPRMMLPSYRGLWDVGMQDNGGPGVPNDPLLGRGC